ncbi:MAG: hypothetical protein Tp172MES00d2C118481931_32 [Prokaryotic dsDNA virus sp.]|nr:MAG: hypothetical protein Tp172MES00d2C118481931_32 [Prokaryotic dsDNA virus sp.]|tara:strand:- start:16286 stop:16417 length:132 start_codon:yes stop_codon:yes gene_type:complete
MSRKDDIAKAIILLEDAIDESGYNNAVADKLFEAIGILEEYTY